MTNGDCTKHDRQFKDETGKVFGKLTAMEYVPGAEMGDSKAYWRCRCECGAITVVAGARLRNGKARSCSTRCGWTGHGMHQSPEYSSWEHMKARCYNKSNGSYRLYGKKGIEVCERWKDSFENFYADMGPKPSRKHSVGRIDGTKGYSPENCRWETPTQQAGNTSRNVYLTYNGETKPIERWARELGIAPNTLRNRLKKGWDVEKALTCPPLQRGKNAPSYRKKLE